VREVWRDWQCAEKENKYSTGLPRRSGEDVNLVRPAFILSQRKPISRVSAGFQMLQVTFHKILPKSL
jgi:hypothetical protein